jgi:hypothetical protein
MSHEYLQKTNPGSSSPGLRVRRSKSLQNLLEYFAQMLPLEVRELVSFVGDNFSAFSAHQGRLNADYRIAFGRITQTIPHAHWYRVQIDHGGGVWPCCRLTNQSPTPLSVRDGDLLNPGTYVMVVLHPRLKRGYILNAVPTWMADSQAAVPDFIQQGGNTGFYRDSVHHAILTKTTRGGGVEDFSNSRPLDAVAGEFSRLSDLGVGLHAGVYQAFIRASEICGVWVNYLDNHLRLAGWNMDLQTAVGEWEIRDDEGEHQWLDHVSVYPWETVGLAEQGQSPFQTFDDKKVIYDLPVSSLEPKFEDQVSLFRDQRYRGYLGQGGMSEVVVPLLGSGIHRRSQPLDQVTVLREFRSLSGTYGLVTADSLSLRKYPLIPNIKRVRRPEDQKDGDGAPDAGGGSTFLDNTNSQARGGAAYSPSGVDGTHRLPQLQGTGSQTIAGSRDHHAFGFNWQAIHPFHYHKKDYRLEEESQHQIFTQGLDKLDYGSAAGGSLPDPVPVTLRVDHRYGELKYYLREVFLDFLKEGHLQFGDGSGCELRMVNGVLEIAAPLDLRLCAGRSITLLAGDDIVARANNSVDISASQRDVRIKADRNIQVLAGNSGEGGLLLESKSETDTLDFHQRVGEDVVSSGVVIRCLKSRFLTWVRGIYLRTGDGTDETGGDDIVIDANQGKNAFRVYASVAERHLDQSAVDYFGREGRTQSANQFTAYQTQLGGSLITSGQVVVGSAGLVVGGNISMTGHVSSFQGGDVGRLTSESLAALRQSLRDIQKALRELVQQGRDQYQSAWEDRWYDDNQPGNTQVITESSFSFRDHDSQYNAERLELSEFRWQQASRLGLASGGAPWRERPVDYQGEKLYPYPGRKKLIEEPSYLEQDLALVDLNRRCSVDRGDGAYEQAELKEPRRVTLNDHYLVVSGG